MNINFHAYVSAATHAIPVLAKTNGSIIVMNSITGEYTSFSDHVPEFGYLVTTSIYRCEMNQFT